MRIEGFKNKTIRFFSVFFAIALVMTGVMGNAYSLPAKAKAPRRLFVGDHKLVTPLKSSELVKVEGEEAEELRKQASVRNISRIGEYAQLLDSTELVFYNLLSGAISQYPPYGTKEEDALAKYAYTIELSDEAFDDFGGMTTEEKQYFWQHVLDALKFDNVDKVESSMCDYTSIMFNEADGKKYVKVAAYAFYPYNYSAMDKKLQNARTRLLSSIPNGNTPQETAAYIHDALIDNIVYYTNYLSEPNQHVCHTAYGALVDGSAVCDGFSSAYAYLLQAKGIDALVITGGIDGDIRKGHAWNRVKLGSEWYDVDCTWDNNYKDIGKTPAEREVYGHFFFNKTTDEFEEGILTDEGEYVNKHITMPLYTGYFIDPPRATGTKYTYQNLKTMYPSLFDNIVATSIITSIDSATIKAGESITATATLAPKDVTNKYVKWISSDSLIADVDGGVITGIASGNVTITAVAGSDISVKKEISITVYTPVTSLALDNTKLTMNIGETAVLAATVTPANADDTSVTWTSSNEAVATVENGTVTGVKNGTVTITAVSNYDASIAATCEVTVKNPVKGLTLDKNDLAMNVGETAILTATITPPDADNTNIKWTSSNEAVATVVNGTVTAVASGTATITAVSESDTSRAAACNVRVSKTAGEEFTTGAGNNTGFYKVIEAQEKTVSFNGDENKNAKTLKVPETIKDENGIAYTVTEIGKGAYKGRKKLKKVVIPKTVKVIRKNAFKGCGKLSKITIYADSLTTIESGAFLGISKDATIIIKASGKTKYNKLVKKIKKAGAKNAKFKRKK